MATLRTRIHDHLDGLQHWRLTTYGSPSLEPEAGVIPALVRFLGSRRFGDRLREVCEVVIVLAPTSDASAIDGATSEAAEEQLLADLDDVEDCYPRLIGTAMNYERTLAAGSRQTYIVLAVQVLGPYSAGMDPKTKAQLPPTVAVKIAALTAQEAAAFEEEFAGRRRSVGAMVALAVLFPVQFFLLDKAGLGIAYWLTLGFAGVGWVVFWFLTPGMTRAYNGHVAADILDRLS